MLQSVGQAATTLAARLIVKPHPRDAKPDFKWLRQDFPELDLVVSRDADLPAHFSAAACVISCASTAGLEAKLAGLPVILLLPAGSADGLPIDLWNWDGVARDALQLTKILKSILAADYQPTRAIDIAHDARIAAEKICERIVPRGVASNIRGSIHIKGDNPLSVE